jgi:hypothetical protein
LVRFLFSKFDLELTREFFWVSLCSDTGGVTYEFLVSRKLMKLGIINLVSHLFYPASKRYYSVPSCPPHDQKPKPVFFTTKANVSSPGKIFPKLMKNTKLDTLLYPSAHQFYVVQGLRRADLGGSRLGRGC